MKKLPDCGIYRTEAPLSGKEEWVREGLLVFFHNHSQQGPPLLLLPASNTNNRWSFHDKGYLVKDEDYPDSLVALMPEGYYVLGEPLYLSPEEMIPSRTLVQLGYNRAADPILFLADFQDNRIEFPTSGLKCTLEVFEFLEVVNFQGPQKPLH
jgi:hypothetical protein